MTVAVEAAAEYHNGYHVRRNFAYLSAQALGAVKLLRRNHNCRLLGHSFGYFFVQIFFDVAAVQQLVERLCFFSIIMHARLADYLLGVLHRAHIVVGKVKQPLERELFVDRIGSVKRAAVGALNAEHSAAQVLAYRVILQRAEVVQPHV